MLDFECGDGTLLSNVAVKRRFGIEVNERCHEAIEKLTQIIDPKIEILENTGYISDESVDIVISNHCMEHLSNPPKVLHEIFRILKHEGKFVSVVPFDDWRNTKKKYYREGDDDRHLYTWSPMNWGNLLAESGFTVKGVKMCHSAWSPRLFWVYKFFGKSAFKIACKFFSFYSNRNEVFCFALIL